MEEEMNPAAPVLLKPEHFDLARRLREDEEFKVNLQAGFDSMADVEPDRYKKPRQYADAQNRVMLDVWEKCGCNMSLLMPFFYPRYPKNRPMDMMERPFNMILLYTLVYHLTVLRGSRQIGKSVSMGTGQRLEANLIDNLRSMYIAPHADPLKTYARKFRELEKAFRCPKIPSKYKQNDYYKEYPNGSTIDLRKVQTTATTVRGVTADVLRGDEMQIFDPSLEVEMLEILNDSEIKSVMYAGTSTTLDTLLEVRYQEGTQGVWQVMLPDGGVIDCGDPESVIPYIGPYCLRDPKTDAQIDPLNGYYKYMNPSGFRNRTLSLHIPQIINPDIALKPLEWNGLYKTLKRDKTKFIQEKLGIPVAEADSEISKGDLQRICVLPFSLDERKEKCRKGYYKMVVSGMDWGGSDENQLTKTKISNTTHGILGVAPDDKVHILYLKRHGGKDYKTIINDIAMAHSQYCAGPLASDFGGGQVYNQLLRGHPLIEPTRHIIFDYDDPRATFIKQMKGDVSNAFLLNRTDSITSLYMAIVMANPLILAPSWDEFGDYLMDFLHMKRVLLENSKGGREFKYQRHASKTDDVVHVVNLAYTLIRMAGNMMLCEDPASRTLLRSAIYGGGYSGTAGDVGNPWAQALSDYARGGEYDE